MGGSEKARTPGRSVDAFYSACDPGKENLCLYGHPDSSWSVSLPAEEIPAELPEPTLGINFARDGMSVRIGAGPSRSGGERARRAGDGPRHPAPPPPAWLLASVSGVFDVCTSARTRCQSPGLPAEAGLARPGRRALGLLADGGGDLQCGAVRSEGEVRGAARGQEVRSSV